jgi:dethiobiotin synthetase
VIRLGVTGTDTGVGKTVVAAAIVTRLRARGLRVAGMKPVETGLERGDPASDAALLRAAAGGDAPEALVCPVVLPEPLAPWLAARRAGRVIELEALDCALDALEDGRDAVVVEGAGGLLVPVTEGVAFDALFRRWDAKLIVVAGNRLGALNHTLLTVQAARAAGLEVRGVVLNALAPATTAVADETNLASLAELLPDLPVIPFPWLENPRDLGALERAAARSGLDAMIADLVRPETGD